MARGSPFPGMDPYLERHWRDVHSSLIVYLREDLQERLPEPLVARIEERVFVESPDGLERVIVPDVRVLEGAGPPGAPAPSPGTIATPLVLQLEVEPVTERFIEIIDSGSGQRVVTVIEVLSITNKLPGDGLELYLRKRRELRAAGVSLVEIDLLRGGTRDLGPRAAPVQKKPYQVVVRRGQRPSQLELYPISLRERLPVIGVPLRDGDADAALDLQAALDRCYRAGRYDSLDYAAPAEPPLAGDDARWVDELLREAGRRA